MTLLQIMADDDASEVRLRTDEADLITAELDTRGIAFGHWPVAADLDAGRPADDPATYNPHSLDIFLDNLRAWRDGRPLPNRFDIARGY